MLTYDQWLAKYGQEPCNGCYWNNAQLARCRYKGKYCARYDEYRKDEKRKHQQPSLF